MALAAREPPIVATDAMLKVWFTKYRIPQNAITVVSATQLHDLGPSIRALAAKHGSHYKLYRALQAEDPPVYTTKHVVQHWFDKYQMCHLHFPSR